MHPLRSRTTLAIRDASSDLAKIESLLTRGSPRYWGMIECTRCGYRNPQGTEFCANPAGCRTYLGYDGKKIATLPGGVSLRISNSTLRVDPGKEVTAELRIHNRSEVVDAYALSAAPAWLTIEPQTVALFPDKEDTVLLRFRPPRGPETPAGQTAFRVTATAKSAPTVSAEHTGTVDVGSFGELAVQMTPRNSRATPTAAHRLAVENRGNTPMQVTLEATDPDGVLRFEIDHPILRIDPGHTEFAQMQIRSAEPAPAQGSAQQHAFHLQVRSDLSSVPPTGVDGSTVLEPVRRRPRSAWLLLLVPVAALLLVAALQLSRLSGGVTAATPAVTSRVPDTTDLLAVDAARLLGTAGFAIDQGHEPSDTTAAGRVIRSDPAANSTAPRNSVVTIVVSSGKSPVIPPPPKPIPQVVITIDDVTLLNSEHTFGDVYLALYFQLRLPDGRLIDLPHWNRGGAALSEGTAYPMTLSFGRYPAGSTLVITGYTDSNDQNRLPSHERYENYQGQIAFGPLSDASHQGVHHEVSRNDKQNPGFRVTFTITPLASQ